MFACPSRPMSFRRAVLAALFGLLLGAASVTDLTAQSWTVANRVYSDAQAARGQR